MNDFPLLSLITFIPAAGALLIMLFIRHASDCRVVSERARNVALLTTIATFCVSLLLLVYFEPDKPGYQLIEYIPWVEEFGIAYHLGVDGVSVAFVLLTTFLMPFCILAGWRSIKLQSREYMVAFLILETLCLGVFTSLDFLLFYFFFEASLIPMFLIIGIWGAENRVYAAFKFFLYTLAGSVLLLIAVVYLAGQFGTTNIVLLTQKAPELAPQIQNLLWLAFFASFAVKVPMWPFHTWLPDAHVQAPTAGSMMLAGVLLKLGAYGLLRFSLPMLPDATMYFAPFVFWLSVVAVIYTSLVAFVQEDMKKMIAYSSVAHMGYVTAGIFTLNIQGVSGAVFQMISHGVVSAALFFCVGILYDRMKTKRIDAYGGVVQVMPKFAFYMLLFTMASVGLPATSGFVGEFLVLVGLFKVNGLVALLVGSGMVLGAMYMLLLYRNVVFGEVVNEAVAGLVDISRREKLILLCLALVTVALGVAPSLLTHVTDSSLQIIIQGVK